MTDVQTQLFNKYTISNNKDYGVYFYYFDSYPHEFIVTTNNINNNIDSINIMYKKIYQNFQKIATTTEQVRDNVYIINKTSEKHAKYGISMSNKYIINNKFNGYISNFRAQ